MTAIISNNIKVPVTEGLTEYCKNNLVFDNEEYIRKKALGKWTGNTPKKNFLYEQRGKWYILPFGVIRDIWKYIKDDYKTDFIERKINVQGDINLYDYQEKAVQKVLRAKNGILVSPTGSGKTVMGIELIKRIGLKTLWLTNKRDLLYQAMDTAKKYLTGCTLGTITDGKINIQDITFATVQTVANMDLPRYTHEWSVIVVDEIHRCTGSNMQVKQFYKVLGNLSCRHKFGITATPKGYTAPCMVGGIIHEVTREEVGERKIPAKVKRINTGYLLKRGSPAIDTDGTVIRDIMLKEIMADRNRNNSIAFDIKYQSDNNSCIVLSDSLQQLKDIKDNVGYGVLVEGKTSKKAREQAKQDMKEGKEKVLYATYALAKEGLDIPCLNRLFLTSPTRNKTTIKQSVGRIERAMEGKDTPMVYDYVDDIGICEEMWTSRRRIYNKNGNEVIYNKI